MGKDVRVVLADDHPLIRSGLEAMLAEEPDLLLVGIASRGEDVIRLCNSLRPDVLLLDMVMPGPPCAEIIAAVRAVVPTIKILILSAQDEGRAVRTLLKVGIDGYILKEEEPETIILAIRTAIQGGVWFSRRVFQVFQGLILQDKMHQEFGLTEREQTLLRLIVRGRSNAHIAAELYLAEQTVRNYISQLYERLEVSSRAEAIVWAQWHGFGEE